MKHYFGYDSDGNIVSTEVMDGGFPEDCNLSDPSCDHPLALNIRNIQRSSNISGYVPFNCKCTESKHCKCLGKKIKSSKVVNGSLVPRSSLIVTVDGETTVSESKFIKPPLSKVIINVTLPGVSSQITAEPYGLARLIPESVALSLTSDNSEEISLIMPAQGLRGGLYLHGKDVTPVKLEFLGFSS